MRPALFATIVILGCGARDALPAPDADVDRDPAGDEDGGAAPDAAPEERLCPSNCTVGHQCCAGTCFGPAVPMFNDCCLCLPGEVSTFDCGVAMCGG